MQIDLLGDKAGVTRQ